MEKYKNNGVVFPLSKDGTSRSSLEGGKVILSKSLERIAPAVAKKALSEKNWRYNYPSYFVDNVKISLASPSNAIAVAKAGLDAVHQSFQFIRDGKAYSFADALVQFPDEQLQTVVIKGEKTLAQAELAMPYNDKILKNEQVLGQIETWATNGTVSPDVHEAVEELLRNPDGYFNLSDKYFVLLGASSEMGPFENLLDLGANIIAIDLPGRPAVWKALIEYARSSPGSLTLPVAKNIGADVTDEEIANLAGCDLLTQTPEIISWLSSLVPGEPLVIGSYTYLDSDLFARIAVAGDWIASAVCERREGVALAFLCSGADVFVVDQHAVDMAEARMGKAWHYLVNKLTLGKFLQNNTHELVVSESGERFFICDGLATIQGPNYALAKRIQHWRAMVSKDAGILASTNIAPATFTQSVEHNRVTFAISRAVSVFEPIVVFERETTKSLMTLLLLYDLYSPDAAANPKVALRNPLELMSKTAVDCGVWRAGVKLGTTGEVSVLIYGIGTALQRLGLPSPLVQRPLSKL